MITYVQRVNVIKTRTFDKLTAIRDLKVEHLDYWLAENRRNLILLSKNLEGEYLEEISSNKILDQNDNRILGIIRDLLILNEKNISSILELYIINPNTGFVQISTNQFSEGLDKSEYTYFTEPMRTQKLFINEIYYSKLSQNHEIAFSAPIFCTKHDKSHVTGIVVARVDLKNSLYKILSDRVGLGRTGETLIVNKDVVALNELRWHDNAPLNLQIEAEAAMYASQGKTGITITTDYRGEKILAAYTYIPETGWGFVCKQDLYELNAPIRDMIKNFIILFLMSAFLIYATALILGNAISKPILDMFAISNRVKSGDLIARNEVQSKDELGSLAQSINELIDSVASKEIIQNGVMNLSSTLIEQSSIQGFGSRVLKKLLEITNSNMGVFYILNERISKFEPSSFIGIDESLLKNINYKAPEGEIGNVLLTKDIYYLKEIPDEAVYKFQTTAGNIEPKEILSIPILIDNTIVALVSLVNIHNFSRECNVIIQQSWLNINSSYSSIIANERTRILAENLANVNQKLEAQTEELQEQKEEMQSQSDELEKISKNLIEQNIELDAQRVQVEEANRLKSQFLSNMSHELRTPLNSILTLSRVTIDQARDNLSKEHIHYLEIVERNGKQLLRLINDILDLSKIEANFVDLNPKKFRIDNTIEMVVESLSPLSEKKNLVLTTQHLDDLPDLESDEQKIHQILTNIIGNAIKFTNRGSITVITSSDAQRISISVKDTGIGIHADMISSIFREFKQVDSSSSRSYEGTGLGLAIAEKTVKLLGGEISVESEPLVGSTFTLTIPIKWWGSLSATESKTISKTEQNKPTLRAPLSQKILIVDNQEESVIQINSMMETFGFRTDVALGGQQALDYLIHTIPDGIILDLMMPHMDGFMVLEAIRKQKPTYHLPILILTAKDLTKDELNKLKKDKALQIIQKGNLDRKQLKPIIFDLFSSKSIIGPPKPELPSPELAGISKNKTKPSPSPKNLKTNKFSILVIEDNPDNLVSLKAILGEKYNILEAIDGKQGLQMTLDILPDLVLLDVMLPKINGIEVIKRIRADKKAKEIPVLALTARTMIGDREKILAAGCNDYLSKPIEVDIIRQKLDEWLGQKV
ncbi:MAG: response regulator [Bacteroidetes bacterium]|nr:response regulator [Bacteroidota bacterium]